MGRAKDEIGAMKWKGHSKYFFASTCSLLKKKVEVCKGMQQSSTQVSISMTAPKPTHSIMRSTADLIAHFTLPKKSSLTFRTGLISSGQPPTLLLPLQPHTFRQVNKGLMQTLSKEGIRVRLASLFQVKPHIYPCPICNCYQSGWSQEQVGWLVTMLFS